jgi:hypothetical protein
VLKGSGARGEVKSEEKSLRRYRKLKGFPHALKNHFGKERSGTDCTFSHDQVYDGAPFTSHLPVEAFFHPESARNSSLAQVHVIALTQSFVTYLSVLLSPAVHLHPHPHHRCRQG